MTHRVRVEEDLLGRHLKIAMFESYADGSGVLHGYPAFGEVRTRVQGGEAVEYPEGYGPLRVSQEFARALFEELGRFFGLQPETASLRQDYDHERKRVDKLIDHLITEPR